MQKAAIVAGVAALLLVASGPGCGDDEPRPMLSQAQAAGVGAACTQDINCSDGGMSCLAFKGGYCGVADCTADTVCPAGSACVAHDDGRNYCFLICTDKSQCNQTRPVADEANCSSSITFVNPNTDVTWKACVPPSST